MTTPSILDNPVWGNPHWTSSVRKDRRLELDFWETDRDNGCYPYMSRSPRPLLEWERLVEAGVLPSTYEEPDEGWGPGAEMTEVMEHGRKAS